MKSFFKKIKSLFEDKKKRYLYLCLFILPFILVIGIFGVVTYKEVKNIIGLLTTAEVKEEYQIKTQNYLLRDNATDYQLEVFTELKEMIEGKVEYTPEQLAESICKNYVVDFYTWSNKAGQYDVGGMYYVYTPQRQTIYIQARDDYYKFLNEYINEYGVNNLLEVTSVNASAKRYSDGFTTLSLDLQTNDYEEAYVVSCSWTYKENEKFNASKYVNKMNFVVVNNEGRFEIVKSYE